MYYKSEIQKGGFLVNKILLLGGDERQKSLANLFERDNIQVFSAFDDAELEHLRPISAYETIILPVPCSADKKHVFSKEKTLSLSLDAVAAAAKNTTRIIGGGFPDGFCAAAQDNGALLFDLLGERDFALFNAHLTAQGAVRLLLENTKQFVVSKKALVTGFGKIAKPTALFLRALGLDVYVAARRKESRTECAALGFKALRIEDLSSCVRIFDFIFNTVPARLFSKNDVLHMKETAVYFELASRPYAARENDFCSSKARYVFGGGLPGRFCSDSCAEKIKETIENFFEKRGESIG